MLNSKPLDLLAEDFEPLSQSQQLETKERPSLSYWQDAWLRLKKNKAAYTSFFIVISLMIFTLFGPYLWPVDPYEQDLMRISRGPSFMDKAIIIPDQLSYEPIFKTANSTTNVPTLPAPNIINIMGIPTTEAVLLKWQPVYGASGYHLFRHEYPPRNRQDLGVPLGEINQGDIVSYMDGLRLEDIDYFYSIVSVDSSGKLSDAYNTIQVSVMQAVKVSDAIRLGYVDEVDADSAVGSTVALQSHPMGTDYLGRDLLARLIDGARTSLFIGIVAPLIFVFFGLFYGGIAGYLGGKTDEIMMRFADFVIALPFLLFMILFKVAFGIGPGESGIMPMLLALVLLSWPSTARLIRGQVLKIREEPYIQAAKLMGASPLYLITKHMLPNVFGLLLVSLTFAIPSAIFTEAFLSFIGMGVAPPTASWGSMCNDGMRTMMTHPHELLFPALFISITVLAFNLFGDGLRDALDVKMKGQN